MGMYFLKRAAEAQAKMLSAGPDRRTNRDSGWAEKAEAQSRQVRQVRARPAPRLARPAALEFLGKGNLSRIAQPSTVSDVEIGFPAEACHRARDALSLSARLRLALAPFARIPCATHLAHCMGPPGCEVRAC